MIECPASLSNIFSIRPDSGTWLSPTFSFNFPSVKEVCERLFSFTRESFCGFCSASHHCFDSVLWSNESTFIQYQLKLSGIKIKSKSMNLELRIWWFFEMWFFIICWRAKILCWKTRCRESSQRKFYVVLFTISQLIMMSNESSKHLII